MTPAPVYLVDSSIYVFRAWFTFPDTFRNQAGELVNAVYGFTDFVAAFLDRTKPTHIVFAFDQSLTTSFRNDLYPDYKANRDPAPEELIPQFQYCREFIRATGISEIASDCYEADDLLGTLATQSQQRGHQVTILSADKDLAQLIGEQDILWDYARNRRLNPKGIEKHFGVRPDQIADQLAIAGDKVDNIPGIPGVGMTTAARLLNRFDTLENLLDNISEIASMKIRGAARIQKLVDEHQDAVRLFKQLTTIECAVTLPETLPITRNHHDRDLLENLFDTLGFGKLRRERWLRILESQAPTT